MIAVVATASKSFSFPAIIRTSCFEKLLVVPFGCPVSVVKPSGSWHGFEGHLKTESLQTPDQIVGEPLRVQAVEVASTQIAVRATMPQREQQRASVGPITYASLSRTARMA